MSAADLDRFYDVPATVVAWLVGGPYDGREQPFPEALLRDVCPRLILVSPSEGKISVADWGAPPRLLERVVYEARRDANGFFSRDDRGRVRFEFWGPR